MNGMTEEDLEARRARAGETCAITVKFTARPEMLRLIARVMNMDAKLDRIATRKELRGFYNGLLTTAVKKAPEYAARFVQELEEREHRSQAE